MLRKVGLAWLRPIAAPKQPLRKLSISAATAKTKLRLACHGRLHRGGERTRAVHALQLFLHRDNPRGQLCCAIAAVGHGARRAATATATAGTAIRLSRRGPATAIVRW